MVWFPVWLVSKVGGFRNSDFLTLKAPITTAADDKFYNIFLNYRKNKV